MKSKILLFAMLMFAGVLSSQAQGQGGQRRTAEERAKMNVDRISDSLKLSATQKTDLEPVYLDYFKSQDKLREGLAPGTRPERADMDKLTEARDAKLKVILKEDQFTKLKELEAAMRNRGGQQRPPGQ
jgi:protein CpxP